MKVYFILWDSEDYRFAYQNETLWADKEKAFETIRTEAKAHQEELWSSYKEDLYAGDMTFDEWIDWCIHNFLYVEEKEVF